MRNVERTLSKATTEAKYLRHANRGPKSVAIRAFNRAERRYGRMISEAGIDAFYADACADECEAFYMFELAWEENE